MMQLRDGAPELSTITREQWQRDRAAEIVASTGAARPCEWCSGPLNTLQIKRGGRFCSSRCAAKFNSQEEYRPKAASPYKPTEEKPMGIVHDLVGDEFDTVTGEKADSWQPIPLPPLTEEVNELMATCLAQSRAWSFQAVLGDVTIHVSRGSK